MKVLTVTIESSITKNLGNYQSTKQLVSLVIELEREVVSADDLLEVQNDLAYLGDVVKNQLTEQIWKSIEAMEDGNTKPF